MINATPDSLHKSKGIKFEITKDDLDYCYAALLETLDGKQFALRNYYRGPRPDGTELIASELSKDSEKDANDLLEILDIPKHDILWRLVNPPPPPQT